MYPYCQKLSGSLNTNFESIQGSIRASFGTRNSRSKRFWQYMAKEAAKKAVSYLPEVGMFGFAVYQSVENQQLEENIETLQKKLVKVSGLMTNINELENSAVGKELNILVDQQHIQQIENRINEYFNEITTLASDVQHRYETLHEMTPIEQLREHVAKIQVNLPNIALPTSENPKDIFDINPVTTFIMHDLATVKFKIPLITSDVFTEYVIVSAPISSNETIILSNGDVIDWLVMDEHNATYFRPSDAVRYTETIYANTIPVKVPLCLKSIFNEGTEQQKLNCGVEELDISREIIFRVGEGDWAVVVSPKWNQTIIHCDKTETLLQSAINIIEFAECDIVTEGSKISANRHLTSADNIIKALSPSLITVAQDELETFTKDPKVNQLLDELHYELESSDDWLSPYISRYGLWIIVGLFIVIISSTTIAGVCWRKARQGNVNVTQGRRAWIRDRLTVKKRLETESLELQNLPTDQQTEVTVEEKNDEPATKMKLAVP